MARSLLIPRLYFSTTDAAGANKPLHSVWEHATLPSTTLLKTAADGTGSSRNGNSWSVIHDEAYVSALYTLTGTVDFTDGAVRAMSRAKARNGLGISAQAHQSQMVVRLYDSSDVLKGTLLSPYEPTVIESPYWADEGVYGSSPPMRTTKFPASSRWTDDYGAPLEGSLTGVSGDYILVELGGRHISGQDGGAAGSAMTVDANKVSDLPVDETDTTVGNSWIEFYAAEPEEPPPDPVTVATGYHVIAREFADTETFGVGDVVADLELFKYLGYAVYVNDVGEMFFTINQDDPKAELLRDLTDRGGHMQVWRGADLMWAGWLGETDEEGDDVVFYAYSYAAGLFERHTEWAQEWEDVTLDTIATDVWNRARTLQSRMGWMTTGTIEAPVTTSGGSVAYTQERYTTYLKRILFVLQELTGAAISDTSNRVMFEITPQGVFNFWKNHGTDLTNILWEWGSPKIIAYRRLRKPVEHRNVILGVGNTPRQATLRSTLVASGDVSTGGGRREESVYLQWVRDQTELNRVIKLRLARARRRDSTVSLTFAPNTIVPFPATDADYQLTDGVRVKIDNGSTDLDEVKLIVGQQVLLYEGQEIVRPLLADTLIAFDDGIRLAHGQTTNASAVTTHPLVDPALSVAQNDVLLVAFIQVRDDQAITLSGWTQRVHVNDGINVGAGEIGYILADKYVASDASPYDEDFTTGSAAYSNQMESIFKVSGPVTPVEFQSNVDTEYPSYANKPSISVTLANTCTIGDLLIAYYSETTATGSVDTGTILPDGWTILETLAGFSQIGHCYMIYKISEGDEDGTPITVTSGQTRTTSRTLIVANYGPVEMS